MESRTLASEVDVPCVPVQSGPTESESSNAPVNELQTIRMDHIHPSEEELSLHGDDWYLYRQHFPSPLPTVPFPRKRNLNQNDDRNNGNALADGPGARGFELAHECRQLLLNLLETTWSPRLQAFSFVAHDPVASLMVRDPRLAFWIRISIPHIRVHLPRGVNSLAVFKGSKENAFERRRALRSGATQNDATPNLPTTPTVMDAGLGTASTTGAFEEAEAEARVVGGDGSGGDLVSEQTRLFEIEVNTVTEMVMDQEWARAGEQMPPQVCRILVGAKDREWGEVMAGKCCLYRTRQTGAYAIGPNDFSPSLRQMEDQCPASPSSSQFLSPSLSFVDLDDDDITHGDAGMDGDNLGESYDHEAAREQRRKMREE